ncbi:hypothetical protein DUNSADRAFT_14147 [Dunaliella salina]|uniref:Uncharacterized protein n=1 Tax=Dunaliella salina TaxID=3046 RepID=A0ABQ7H2Q7_DUNSA|nr:hypothetical protein DUNSADRAFT_14147 [Dunaliella salina]|eukprot:KAF5841144.1 hypothetical protein DUNSADRAFT_14147 [Dunaliella salina]
MMHLQQLPNPSCLHSTSTHQRVLRPALRCRSASSFPPPPFQKDAEGELADNRWDVGLATAPRPTTRPPAATYAKPSVTSTGTLMPSAEWYPAWMRYRKREDNHVFWTDKFKRNSLDILPAEKRWTIFSTFWYLVMQFRFFAVPPAFRFFIAMGWRRFMFAAYGAHKALVLWQCKVDAALAAQGLQRKAQSTSPSGPSSSRSVSNADMSRGSSSSSNTSSSSSSSSISGSDSRAGESSEASSSDSQGNGSSSSSSSSSQGLSSWPSPGFSKTMALRRLHWQNSLLGEVMYMVNLYKTGRIHLLPPVKKPAERPTFFWLF